MVQVGERTVQCGQRFSKPSFNEGNSVEHYRKRPIFIIFWPFPIRYYFIVTFPKLVRKTVISISKKRQILSLFIIQLLKGRPSQPARRRPWVSRLSIRNWSGPDYWTASWNIFQLLPKRDPTSNFEIFLVDKLLSNMDLKNNALWLWWKKEGYTLWTLD